MPSKSRAAAIALLGCAVAAPALGIALSLYAQPADLSHAEVLTCGQELPERYIDIYAPRTDDVFYERKSPRDVYYHDRIYPYAGTEPTTSVSGKTYVHSFSFSYTRTSNSTVLLKCSPSLGGAPVYAVPHKDRSRNPACAFLGGGLGLGFMIPGALLGLLGRQETRQRTPSVHPPFA